VPASVGGVTLTTSAVGYRGMNHRTGQLLRHFRVTGCTEDRGSVEQKSDVSRGVGIVACSAITLGSRRMWDLG